MAARVVSTKSVETAQCQSDSERYVPVTTDTRIMNRKKCLMVAEVFSDLAPA